MPTLKAKRATVVMSAVQVACPYCEAPQESPRGSFHWDEFDKDEERACCGCGKRMVIKLAWNRSPQ